GNFDENLIYVNDIEIYRPQLIQNGQQEGLSFINPDLVGSLKFSAGGFDPQYGDKMSSVLDVTYKQPEARKWQFLMGTMLNSATFQGQKGPWAAIIGGRTFSNALLAKSLNTQGTYRMRFGDIQAHIDYKPSPFWNFQFLGNTAANRFELKPLSRQTEFGTVTEAYQLEVYMAGAENLDYQYQLGAFTANYKPSIRQSFKFIASLTHIQEQEYFDVEGAYFLNQLDRDLGSSNLGKPLKTLGYGYYLDHGRNQLRSQIINLSHLGTVGRITDRFSWKYGIRLNRESVDDRFFEWMYSDSAGYNTSEFGYLRDSLFLDPLVRANNSIQSLRSSAYMQGRWRLSKAQNIWLNAGFRVQHWSLNQQTLFMPRVNFNWEPNQAYNRNRPDSTKKPDVVIKLAFGAYHQAPFYREMRGFDGALNTQLQAQEAWHSLLGMDRYTLLWNRPFKFSSEAYIKTLNQLVPYLYDNMRIRYFASNSGQGFAWGWDNRINGQFIEGLESWFTLSIMQSKEQLSWISPSTGRDTLSAWLRRPTDRRVQFAAVFQDELPSDPSVRINLNIIIGTGMPYYLDGPARYSSTPNAVPPYRRVDLGLSKTLEADSKLNQWLGLSSSFLSMDVFNLLDINNVIAYSWVKDLNNNRYGVPEYLTGRRLNLRFQGVLK
ncbi:MAG: TonB-dependent receptor plug domain-containing protein, partial [Bacteroidia bacterium]